MTTLIAHIGHSMHFHAADLIGVVVLSTIIYAAAICAQRPRKVSVERIKALREYVNTVGRRGSK